jgi:hypothetical protein
MKDGAHHPQEGKGTGYLQRHGVMRSQPNPDQVRQWESGPNQPWTETLPEQDGSDGIHTELSHFVDIIREEGTTDLDGIGFYADAAGNEYEPIDLTTIQRTHPRGYSHVVWYFRPR